MPAEGGGALKELVLASSKRSHDLFSEDHSSEPLEFSDSRRIKVSAKVSSEYSTVRDVPAPKPVSQAATSEDQKASESENPDAQALIIREQEKTQDTVPSNALVKAGGPGGALALSGRRQAAKVPVPQWHAPWKLKSVISGHLGWVRAIAFDPSNKWFVTGAADRTLKIWDLAKCSTGSPDGLMLTLTGHISTVRGVAVSERTTYLFSCAEDKMVKCWDLEQNKVVRHYHGHLSGVYSLALHPTLDLLVTAGRDSVARVWDVRTARSVHTLGGHSNTIGSVFCNAVDPQVVTGSHDCMIRLWDLAAGKTMMTLTNHKKSVRCMARHPREYSFVSGGSDNLKKWQLRDGRFMKNLTGHNTIVNALAVNEDGVLVSGGDNGSLHFWDYDTGYNFQQTDTIVQPGSLDAEAAIYAMSFDMTGSRLITCEADKTLKIWAEDPGGF